MYPLRCFAASHFWLLTAALLLPTFAAAADSEDAFPKFGLLPKREIGALKFLEEHPQFDGRGVVVAIFDTGVDPAAAGLQKTADGRPKIIDMVDGTGSGDVDMSVVRAVKDGVLEGRSGRPLKIPKEWKNPSGRFRVGVKRGYDIYAADLVKRVQAKRNERWLAQQRKRRLKLEDAVALHASKHPRPNAAQRKERVELQSCISLLDTLIRTNIDPGPIYDCVVFHDGKVLRAAIDTDEDGDLSDEALMTNYRREQQYAVFDDESQLSFAVNMYHGGRLLSIVTDCGTHGTHVAGIVAGNYPERPEMNGVAPGAQIVSVRIGDHRLGSSSTGTGQVRGLIAVLRNKCDLINMSYGGSTSDPNSGKVTELYKEIVNKHQVIFVSSAGNNGPALSTAGSPGGTTSALIGVGAYVSPELMEVAYAHRQTQTEAPFTWSSRGPTADGDLGVDICAPGGAISPISRWSLRKNKLGNGTSMSSPNACGGLALLLSGLKAESVAYSPQSVRRAVVNSARQLDPERSDVFSQGAGLLQVDAAYSYLKTNAGKSAAEHVRFQVTVPGRDNARGIYLRDGEAANVAEMTVSVKPIFPEKTTNEVKAEFEMSISLESSQPWLEAPAHLATVNASRSFGVRIDPTELEPGSHYAEIVARDALAPDAGSLFKIPITVLRTVQLDDRFRWRDTVELSSAQIERRFFAVPAGATWVDIKMRAGDLAASRRLVTHVLQQPPQRANGRGFQREYITFESGGEAVRSYPVVGGHTLEWCIGQYWSSLGDSEFELELEFHGLPPSSPDVHLSGGRISTRVEVTAPLANEKIAPTATLDTLRQNYPPSKTQIRRLSAERDRLPNDRQIYELINTYQFSLAATTRVTARTGVSAQSEANLSWQSMLWQIFDVNKRLRASGNSGKSATLAKGVYTLRFHLRSASLAEIKRIEKTPLLLDHRLAKPITLKIHADPDDAVRGSPTFKALNLLSGQRAVLHVAHPSRTSLPKAARGGDELRGRIYFGEESKQDGAGRNPRGYAISYSTPSSSTSTTTSSSRTSSPADYLFQAKMQRLTALREQQKRDDFAALLKEILKEKPNHLPALIENVKIQDDEDRKARLPDVVKACSRVLKRINRKRLASHYGVRLNTTDAKAVQERKKNDEQKKILIDMLYRKGWAVAFMDLPPKPGQPMEIPKRPKNSEARDKLFEETYAELARWIDMSDPQVILLNIRRERRQKRPAAALKLLDKAIAATPLDKRLYQKRADIFGELGWKDWQAVELKRMITRYPDHYPGF